MVKNYNGLSSICKQFDEVRTNAQILKSVEYWRDRKETPTVVIIGFKPIGTVSAKSVESDLGCASRVYFDKFNVTLTSQKTYQHNDKCVIAEKQTVTSFHKML